MFIATILKLFVASNNALIIGPYWHKNQIIGIISNLADILDAFITI